MPRLTRAWLAIGALFGAPACNLGPALTEPECERLLEHYTDKQIDQARPSTPPGVRARLIQDALVRAATDPVFLECSRKVSRSQYECAMAAGTADAVERCLL